MIHEYLVAANGFVMWVNNGAAPALAADAFVKIRRILGWSSSATAATPDWRTRDGSLDCDRMAIPVLGLFKKRVGRIDDGKEMTRIRFTFCQIF